MPDTILCPCCGAEMRQPPVNVRRYLTPQQCQIYDAVRHTMPEGISSEYLFAKLYGHRSDGGPLSGYALIRTQVRYLNIRLERFGVRLFSRGHHWMVRTTPQEGIQEVTPHKKLTDEQVRAIRADRRSNERVGLTYGISRQNVWQIRAGRTWKHVT